jgi:hypothetical protein
MRVKTDKFRTKRTNKRRMTEQQVQRASAKRKKYALLDQWFDDQPEQEAIAHHLNRRYP